MRGERREGGRGTEDRASSHGALFVLVPHLHGPHPPVPPRTLDQQLEALGVTQEGDRGRGGLTRVGAGRIKGDGAERERGATPQGY